MSNVTMQPHSY